MDLVAYQDRNELRLLLCCQLKNAVSRTGVDRPLSCARKASQRAWGGMGRGYGAPDGEGHGDCKGAQAVQSSRQDACRRWRGPIAVIGGWAAGMEDLVREHRPCPLLHLHPLKVKK